MTRPSSTKAAPVPLYPNESDLARLVMGERAKEWPARAIVLEREGLPQIDPLLGGRYLPAVRRFFDSRNRLVETPDTATDTGENWQ